MKNLYKVTVRGDSESFFEEYYTEEEIRVINKFFDDMAEHKVASYDVPIVEFDKKDKE